MENPKSSSNEKEILRMRGFFVQKGLNTLQFIKNVCMGFGISSSIIFLAFMLGSYLKITTIPAFASVIIAIGAFIILLKSAFQYAQSSNYFYTRDGIIAFGGIYKSLTKIKEKENEIFMFLRIYKGVEWVYSVLSLIFASRRDSQFNFWMINASFSCVIMALGTVMMDSLFPVQESMDLLRNLLIFLAPVIIIFTTSIISKFFINHFHPLYAFGNLGEKIQKFTPEIESQSQLIQSEFQKDMNFSVLHSGFEKLSRTFSSIVELVLKLEKIEAQANKGNLFDSEKYIGSLRADIVTPLVKLKKFLEGQRKQLLESQKELSRVRVGGDPETSSGGQENIELQSKRSESLLQELDTNIAALGEMVEKMG